MTDSHRPHAVNRRILKFNVGYLLAQGAGHQRTNEIDLPQIEVADDVVLDFLRGALRFTRNSRGILVQGALETRVLTDCARCLSTTTVPVTLDIEELYSYPPSDETLYSVEESGMLDMAPLLREEAILSVPMGVVCQPDCAGLCPQCGQNFNEGSCDCDRETIDPRLAVLKELKENLSTD